MTFDFPGVTLSRTPEFLLLQSDRPLLVLSSAIVGGGLLTASRIINRHVDKDYRNDDPVANQAAFAQAHGVRPPFAGLMTAVNLDKTRTATQSASGMTVTAVVTAGIANATCAGISTPAAPHPGTINIIVLVDANLTPAALVNAAITVTEVKTHTLLERGVRTPDGHPATGTSTDAIVIACTGKGDPLPYAGPLTPVGWLIGKCVRACMQEALA